MAWLFHSGLHSDLAAFLPSFDWFRMALCRISVFIDSVELIDCGGDR
jgi:hypothetical protein